MQQNLIENEIKCKIHGETIILYNQDECENFESRLYCLSCFDNKSPSRVIKFQKIIEQMNEYKVQQANAANTLKQQILNLQEQFYQQFLLFKKNLESQLNQVQLQYQDWVDKIKNYEGAISGKCSLLEQLESFSKEKYQNVGFKKEIQEINISQYQQMYKLLDDFNFQDNQDQLRGILQNVFDVFKIESLEDRVELKPIKYSQKQSSFLNIVCKEHNIYVQNIDLEENLEDVRQRLKCVECRVGKAVSVTKFFEIFSKLKEVQNKVVYDKRQIFIKQMNYVKQYFIQVRKQYIQQLKQFIQELDLSIITEINQEAVMFQRQVECLKEEDIIQMIYQILNCDNNQNTFQEETDLESRQSATNSIIIQNSSQINQIILNDQSHLLDLIKQTSDQLEQQTDMYKEKQRQISDFLVKVRAQDQKEVQKEDQLKQSILEVKQELLSYNKSSFEQLQYLLNEVQIETKSQFCKIEEKFSNQDQNIKNISDQNKNEQISFKSMIGQLSQKIDQQVESMDKKEKETIKQLDLLKNGQKSSIEQLSKQREQEAKQQLTKLENQEQRVEKIKKALNYLAPFHFNYTLVDSNQVQDNYSNSTYFPYGLTFNYKGDLLISSYFNQIQIRGFNNQALTGVQSTLQAQSNYIYVIVSSRKYNWFFAGEGSGYISSYKEVNGQWQATHQKQHTLDIYGILLNKEENQLVTCSCDKTIKIWKIDYNANSITLEYTLEQKHNHKIYCICFNFNENQIVSASYDKLIIIWEKGNNNKWSFKQQINNQYIGYRVQFISDTQFALTIYEKGIIQVFNQVNGQYTEIQQVQLTYDGSDVMQLFNSIYLQQQQILISKHNKYVYFLKKCNVDGKLKIISTPIDSLDSYTFGAVTQDGQYLVLENRENGQYRVYTLEYLSISDI